MRGALLAAAVLKGGAVRRLPVDALRNQAPLAGAYLADAFFERLPDPPAPPPEAPPAPPLQAPPAGCGGEVGADHAWPGADQAAGAGPGALSDCGSGGRAVHGRGGPAEDPAPGSLPAGPRKRRAGRGCGWMWRRAGCGCGS